MHVPDPARRRPWGPAARDAALRRTRRLTRLVVVGAAALSGAFSAVAAQAFKGHGQARPRPAAPARVAPAPRVAVPGPQRVPAIAGTPGALQPPSAPPAAAAPAAQPAPAPPPPPPVVSGGS